MSEHRDLRLACMKLAIDGECGSNAEQLIKSARAFMAFVLEQDETPKGKQPKAEPGPDQRISSLTVTYVHTEGRKPKPKNKA